MNAAIRTQALRKTYPPPKTRRRPTATPSYMGGNPAPDQAGSIGANGEIVALDALDLEVGAGEFFGLLGPNGAGKTTTIGVLTTRILPTAGRAFVHGLDVVGESVAVRRRIGVVPQRPNPDRGLTAIENLVFHAAYFGFSRVASRQRAEAILVQLGLEGRGDAKVDELSGGLQQRLMIARALIHEPQLLFLDEPTVGLDPQARLALWDILRALHKEGRTIVMTTHYMEEADRLCDRIAILDRGRLLALDTPAALKRRAPGGTLIELTLDGDAAALVEPARALPGALSAVAEGAVLRVYHPDGGQAIGALIGLGNARGRQVINIHIAPPSLETLFVSLTGRKLD
ncbi:MAG: ABC transporter ATP-binding protein [Gemmatimonadales bacterium]